MKPLRKRHEVVLDLASIYAWIGTGNLEAAERFLEAVAATFEQIQTRPEIGWERSWKHPKLKGIRSWRVESFRDYLIFYREEETAIELYAVLHGARHLERALKRR